jgi:ribonuclease P protein component
MDFKFPHTERLKSRKTIDRLFKEGNSFLAFPLKVVWVKQTITAASDMQLAVTVPKRVFKSAVMRNLIKRRIKEAWRLNKPALAPTTFSNGNQYALIFIYVGRVELPYSDIEKGVKKALKNLPFGINTDA